MALWNAAAGDLAFRETITRVYDSGASGTLVGLDLMRRSLASYLFGKAPFRKRICDPSDDTVSGISACFTEIVVSTRNCSSRVASSRESSEFAAARKSDGVSGP